MTWLDLELRKLILMAMLITLFISFLYYLLCCNLSLVLFSFWGTVLYKVWSVSNNRFLSFHARSTESESVHISFLYDRWFLCMLKFETIGLAKGAWALETDRPKYKTSFSPWQTVHYKLCSQFESQFPHTSNGNSITPLQYCGNEKKQYK